MDLVQYFLKKEYIRRIMQDSISGSLLNCYMFTSPDEKTNELCLEALYYAIICNNHGCGECANCKKIKALSHPDIITYPLGKSFSVNDSKDIIEQANIKPMLCDKKLIVIKNLDNSSEEAQNKLLKILEEPPQNVVFFITCLNSDKVLNTVKSRLLKIDIPPLKHEEMEDILSEYKNNDCFDIAISKGGGYIGKTLSILEDENYLNNYNLALNIVCKLKSSAEVINYISPKLTKEDFNILLENLSSLFRDILMLNCGATEILENKQAKVDLLQVSHEYSNKALIKIINKIDELYKKQFSNISITLMFETLLVNILEVKFLCK